jgi:hypothetical protein
MKFEISYPKIILDIKYNNTIKQVFDSSKANHHNSIQILWNNH